MEQLRKEVLQGLTELDGGEFSPLDIEAIKREGRARLAARKKGQEQ